MRKAYTCFKRPCHEPACQPPCVTPCSSHDSCHHKQSNNDCCTPCQPIPPLYTNQHHKSCDACKSSCSLTCGYDKPFNPIYPVEPYKPCHKPCHEPCHKPCHEPCHEPCNPCHKPCHEPCKPCHEPCKHKPCDTTPNYFGRPHIQNDHCKKPLVPYQPIYLQDCDCNDADNLYCKPENCTPCKKDCTTCSKQEPCEKEHDCCESCAIVQNSFDCYIDQTVWISFECTCIKVQVLSICDGYVKAVLIGCGNIVYINCARIYQVSVC